jgi:SpoIID/LytB domain protein
MRKNLCAAFLAAVAAVFIACALHASSPLDDYYSDNLESGVDSYRAALKDNKTNKMSYFELASVLKEFGRNEEAYGAYHDILSFNDSEYRAHFEMAKMYYFLNSYDQAEEEIKVLAFKSILNWEVYYWWGCILLEKGDLDGAAEKLGKAVEADKLKNITYIKLGELYEKKADLKQAIDNYKLAIKYDKTYSELNRRIAILYEKEGQKLNSYSYWKKVGDIDTDDTTAIRKIADFMASLPVLREKAEEFIEYRKKTRSRQTPPDRPNVKGSSDIPEVRVGLMEGAQSISFKCGSNFALVNDRMETIFRGSKLTEYFFMCDRKKKNHYFSDGRQRIYFQRNFFIMRDNPESSTTVYNVQYAEGFYWSEKKDTTYRGDFEVIFQDNGLTLVNILNMEEYLYGVIPAEIPPTWPAEALKSQAVAARTYTFKHMDKHRAKGYDVCNQQHCAVYDGVSGEYRATNQAVDDTRGQVLYGSNYKMLDTFYSHDCGGHTQDVNEVWGLKRVASLGGVYDGKKAVWSFPLSPFFLEEYVRTLPDVYCKATGAIETSFRWIRYLDADGLEYYFNRNNKLGKIKDIKPLRRAKGGALIRIRVTGDKGEKEFGFDAMRNVLGKIRSNVIKWEYKKDAEGFIKEIYIYGAGWGHGVGMCQRGLKGMAEDRQGYESILYHYFPGSYIKTKY